VALEGGCLDGEVNVVHIELNERGRADGEQPGYYAPLAVDGELVGVVVLASSTRDLVEKETYEP
jgi:hypothetical protein